MYPYLFTAVCADNCRALTVLKQYTLTAAVSGPHNKSASAPLCTQIFTHSDTQTLTKYANFRQQFSTWAPACFVFSLFTYHILAAVVFQYAVVKYHTSLFLTSQYYQRLPLSSTNAVVKIRPCVTLVNLRLHF